MMNYDACTFPGVNPLWLLVYSRRVCVRVAADLFDERPPVARKWPASLPRICRQPWPLYMSAGISLCAIPGGKLRLLVLPERERRKKLLPLSVAKRETSGDTDHRDFLS